MPKLAALLLSAVVIAGPTIALADPATLCAPFKSAWASKGRSAPGIPAVCVDYFSKSQPAHAATTAPPAKLHTAAPTSVAPQRIASAKPPPPPPPAPPEPDLAPTVEPAAAAGAMRGGRGTPWMRGNAAMAAQDYGAAMTFYKEAAANGNIAAEVNIGALYAKGLGVPVDYAQAMTWYQKAADAGNPRAEWSIGVLYAKGLGVPEDGGKALSWYLKAAARGSPAAAYDIGLFYLNGWGGLTADAAQARSWFVRAAAGGNAEARDWLAAHPG